MNLKKLKLISTSLTPCSPPVWARSGHSQTILGHLLPSQAITKKGEVFSVTLEKEEERIHSTYYLGTTNTVIYLFHGLGGSSDATYMQRTALMAQKLGHHVFINNHRGCGEGVGLASEPYHSGRSEDLSQVIAFGRKKFPTHKHIAIGFSLSANALLLLAAKVRADVQPDAAIAVNAPINLNQASLQLSQGMNRIYDNRFVAEIKQHVRRNHPESYSSVKKVRDLRDFDDAYTAPRGGFKNKEEYYKICSAKQYLKQISIPTVILTAEDDPFVSVKDYQEAEISPQVILHIEKHGGHMGYIKKNKLGYSRWLDYALEEYLKGMTEVTP